MPENQLHLARRAPYAGRHEHVVGFWSYFVEGGPGIDITAPTPFTPYATSTQEAVDCLGVWPPQG
ncbi:hypothetical protein ABZZ04_05350 [Streptomyces sp. NPDC006435]|uniref:hypothetical protein n=1 Tax=Streptomyces sp. NPDC006435 TaxID=3154300 RepID=UPI0033B2FDE1